MENQNVCLFYTSIRHLLVIVNDFIANFANKKITFISDYNPEQMYLNWIYSAQKINFELLKDMEFEKICKSCKSDIVIRISDKNNYDFEENIIIDCYNIFENKLRINEILNDYKYMLSSGGIIKTKTLFYDYDILNCNFNKR